MGIPHPIKRIAQTHFIVYNSEEMAKLAKMLLQHESADLMEIDTPNVPSVILAQEPFKIPKGEGLSTNEFIEEAAPGYLKACMEMAQRAMAGQVNVFKEGDYPHKMALLLAHKLIPYKKWKDKLPDESPSEVKKTARALKSLIKSLSEDGEIVVDTTRAGMDKSQEIRVAEHAAAAAGRRER